MTLSYVNQGAQTYPPYMYSMDQNGQEQYPQQWNMPSGMSQQSSWGYGQAYGSGYQMPQSSQYSSPSYSAVKIDINGATVGTGGSGGSMAGMPMYPGRAQMMRPATQYMPPNMAPPPNMPPVYNAGYNTPPYIPPSGYMMPPNNMAPIPPQGMNNQQPLPAPAPPPVINQTYPQPPIPSSENNTQQPPVAPPPPAIDQADNQQPINNNIQNQTQDINQQQPIGQIDPAVKPLAQAINTITPPPGQEMPLQQEDQAIRTIAQYAQTYQAANDMVKADPTNPTALQAKEKVDKLVKQMLIDEKVFKGLISVATEDTSNLSGPEKQQAEENKIISMWSLALLQRLFREEVNQELAKDNIPPMSLGEIPGVEQVVGNIKADPNPKVREAGIVALREVADPTNPKDKEIMNAILNIAAKQDSSKDVRTVAQSALQDFQTAGKQ